MNLEILKWTPVSGEFEEKHFGVTDPNPMWIKFCPTDSANWTGSFASGEIGLINEKIVEIDKTSKIGILTNGAFYLIHKDSKDLLLNPRNGYFTDFEILLEENLVFLATNWGIYIFKDNTLIKEIRPDFIDGWIIRTMLVLRHIWGRTKSYKNIAQIFDIQINMFIISW